MSDLRVVLDANIVVSAILLHDSLPRRAFDAAASKGKLLLSVDTVAELDDVLRRSKFNRYVSELERLEFLAVLVSASEQVAILDTFQACRDPRDDKYLELAVNGRASHIISGDEDLLILNPFQGISIVTPQNFLESLPD